ncbi:MAG TPA: hypothetical protein VMU88_00490, partial [bacterium]|nr:hypothetical protein [bacterium]
MKKALWAAVGLWVGWAVPGWATPLQTLSAGASPRALALGEVLRHGETDLLVANFGSPTFIGQKTSPASTASSTVQIFSPSPMGLRLAATLATQAGPRGLAAMDLDGSGLESILVGDYDAQKLEIFKWQSGSFQKSAEASTPAQPVGLAVGSTSVRGGGQRFAAVADYGAGEVSLFPLSPSGIGGRVDVRVSGNPVQVAIGDFDGDGQNEIAVADLTGDKIDLLKM